MIIRVKLMRHYRKIYPSLALDSAYEIERYSAPSITKGCNIMTCLNNFLTVVNKSTASFRMTLFSGVCCDEVIQTSLSLARQLELIKKVVSRSKLAQSVNLATRLDLIPNQGYKLSTKPSLITNSSQDAIFPVENLPYYHIDNYPQLIIQDSELDMDFLESLCTENKDNNGRLTPVSSLMSKYTEQPRFTETLPTDVINPPAISELINNIISDNTAGTWDNPICIPSHTGCMGLLSLDMCRSRATMPNVNTELLKCFVHQQ
jgi:hypothetical protein